MLRYTQGCGFQEHLIASIDSDGKQPLTCRYLGHKFIMVGPVTHANWPVQTPVKTVYKECARCKSRIVLNIAYLYHAESVDICTAASEVAKAIAWCKEIAHE